MRKLINNICLLALILICMSWPLIAHLIMNIQANTAGCKGVELYYTNTTFEQDWLTMTNKVFNECEKVPDNWTTATKLYDFYALENCTGKAVDCEDVSHYIMCIAEEYDIECKYYTDVSIGYSINLFGHRGIRCDINGRWQELF